MTTQPAVCEIGKCGVQAIGRCATCNKAFCESHQGFRRNFVSGAKLGYSYCLPCFRVAETERETTSKIGRAIAYFESGTALGVLRSSSSPVVDLYRVELKWRGHPLGWVPGVKPGKSYSEGTPVGKGWVIGEFDWVFDEAGPPYDSVDYRTRKKVTVITDIGQLHPVNPYEDGYVVIDDITFNDYIEAQQAVKKLAAN